MQKHPFRIDLELFGNKVVDFVATLGDTDDVESAATSRVSGRNRAILRVSPVFRLHFYPPVSVSKAARVVPLHASRRESVATSSGFPGLSPRATAIL